MNRFQARFIPQLIVAVACWFLPACAALSNSSGPLEAVAELDNPNCRSTAGAEEAEGQIETLVGAENSSVTETPCGSADEDWCCFWSDGEIRHQAARKYEDLVTGCELVC